MLTQTAKPALPSITVALRKAYLFAYGNFTATKSSSGYK